MSVTRKSKSMRSKSRKLGLKSKKGMKRNRKVMKTRKVMRGGALGAAQKILTEKEFKKMMNEKIRAAEQNHMYRQILNAHKSTEPTVIPYELKTSANVQTNQSVYGDPELFRVAAAAPAAAPKPRKLGTATRRMTLSEVKRAEATEANKELATSTPSLALAKVHVAASGAIYSVPLKKPPPPPSAKLAKAV